MRFLFLTYDALGHALPVSAAVKELLARGHEVVWIGGRDVKDVVEKTGATYVPTNKLAPLDDAAKPKYTGPLSVRRMVDAFKNERTLAQVEDCRMVLAKSPVDCLVFDMCPSGAQALYELGEVPTYAMLQVFPLWATAKNLPVPFTGMTPPRTTLQYFMNEMIRMINYYFVLPFYIMRPINADRVRLGLPKVPTSEMGDRFSISPFLSIQTSSPSLEMFDADLLRKYNQCHFVGPLTSTDAAHTQHYERWTRLMDHPRLIMVTQGTFATDPLSLILPTIRALGTNSDLRIIVTTSHVEALKERETIPQNTHLEQYVPYELLLSRARLLISNGGYGGVKQALQLGVPLVLAGTTEDKKDVCARVEANRAGINLRTDNPSEDQIKHAVSKVLEDQSFRDNAKRISEEFESLGGVAHAADLLEQLAETKKAVLRQT